MYIKCLSVFERHIAYTSACKCLQASNTTVSEVIRNRLFSKHYYLY